METGYNAILARDQGVAVHVMGITYWASATIVMAPDARHVAIQEIESALFALVFLLIVGITIPANAVYAKEKGILINTHGCQAQKMCQNAPFSGFFACFLQKKVTSVT